MVGMFKDTHGQLNLSRAHFNPLLCTELFDADDTALITSGVNAMNRILQKIEEHAAHVGLNSTRKKVALDINTGAKPRFANGDKVEQETFTLYLGAHINVKDDARMEVNM